MGLRVSTLNQRAIRHFRDLNPLATWAEQIAAEDAMHLTLDFEDFQHTLSPGVRPVESILSVLQGIRALSRLHMIARALDSDFVLSSDMVLSEDDFQDINLAFELLKGERKAINIGPIEVEPSDKAAMKMTRAQGELLCRTTWQFSLGGQSVGSIPIEINLPDYDIETTPGTGKVRIHKGKNGKAWMTYAEHGDTSNRVARTTK